MCMYYINPIHFLSFFIDYFFFLESPVRNIILYIYLQGFLKKIILLRSCIFVCLIRCYIHVLHVLYNIMSRFFFCSMLAWGDVLYVRTGTCVLVLIWYLVLN